MPGDLDTTFGTGGTLTTNVDDFEGAYAVAVQPDGKIVVAGPTGTADASDFVVLRYLSHGALDTTFDGDGIVRTPVGGVKNYALGVALQSDGKIVVAGYATRATGLTDDIVVVRYNPDGSLDGSFSSDGIFLSGHPDYERASAVAIQPNGKIVVAGKLGSSFDSDILVVRLTAEGTLDDTFGPGGARVTAVGDFDEARALTLQADGKIVVAGTTSPGSGLSDFVIVRHLPDGTRDPFFDGDGVTTASVGTEEGAYGVAVDDQGRIVAAGTTNREFPTFMDFGLVRFLSDGSLDSSFGEGGMVAHDLGSGYDQLTGLALQGDGKILASGSFDGSQGFEFVVARYLSDGSPDSLFSEDGWNSTPFGSTSIAFDLALQTDGNIVLAG